MILRNVPLRVIVTALESFLFSIDGASNRGAASGMPPLRLRLTKRRDKGQLLALFTSGVLVSDLTFPVPPST